ncbi:MAG: cell division protein FtsW [Candidatus Melainabacteria bacterium]|nr:cell division protein FtsW [Candidatus Melainabacteria bacterium]
MKKEGKSLKNWFVNFQATDRFLIQLTLALSIIGLIFAFSSSTYESYRLTNNFWTLGFKQLLAFLIGVFFLLLFWNTNFKFWFKATWFIAVIMLILMIITVFSGIGKLSGGSQRWIDIGFFQLQPAEITKFAVILLISKFLTKYKWLEFKKYYYLIFSFVLILIILKQPDLGSATILFLLILQLLFIFGWPIWLLVPVVSIISLIGTIIINLNPYQLDRIKFWQNPYLEPQGRGYNLIQAKYAFGFGGLWGVGLGNSIQKQGHLPIPHSDFIFAIIAEELGFIGITAILILYITWILWSLVLLNKVQNKYGRILGTAIVLLITTQAVINIAVAVGLLPVTGVTLPFFSCGGTSLIVTLAMCGILFNIISNTQQTSQP